MRLSQNARALKTGPQSAEPVGKKVGAVAENAEMSVTDAPAKLDSGVLGAAVLVGLIGRGIGLSRTPRMHEVEGARQGLRTVYKLLDTDTMGATPPAFAEILRAAELTGYAGLNVTYPYKQEAIAHLDVLSDAARAVGSVNTIVFRDGKRYGHNTDCWGFAESFRRNMDGVARGNVLLLGAGGAGVAVAQALLDCGVETLWVFDCNPLSARSLVEALQQRFGETRARLAEDVAALAPDLDGIVNATPVGMAKLPGTAIPTSLLAPSMWVADIVYFPIETALLRAARELGCRTMPGSGMAVFQAVRAFELFTGKAPDVGEMQATFEGFAD